MNLPELPEWSKMDDLGGLVPSEIRTALRAHAEAARRLALEEASRLIESRMLQRALLKPGEKERTWPELDHVAIRALIDNPDKRS